MLDEKLTKKNYVLYIRSNQQISQVTLFLISEDKSLQSDFT